MRRLLKHILLYFAKKYSMNVLILGSGGREHTLAWKIAQSPEVQKIFVAPGNAGTGLMWTNVPIGINDFDGIRRFVLQESIQMVIVGPEEPLVNGIYDFFINDSSISHISVIGPSKLGAQLEGSKDFAKAFMRRHNIPTAAYRSFTRTEFEAARLFLLKIKPPYVLKADGLAAGKGVIICNTIGEAEKELEEMLVNARFGKASEKVVIEEFLHGTEVSVFVLTDGKNWKLLPEAKDYKRIGDGDTGPNTGGMGSVSPVPFADESFMKKVVDRIINPTVNGLKLENIDYKGFIFAGLMNVGGDPYVIEYNVRMGDPETESVIPRIKSDLVPLLKSLGCGTLKDQTIEIDGRTAATIMLVSAGYPGDYPKGLEIYELDKVDESIIFHAGTALNDNGDRIITAGGRVLAVTSLASATAEALEKSYRSAAIVDYLGKTFRRDIGRDILK